MVDPIDESGIFALEEKGRSEEIKTAEELIKRLREL